MIADRDGPVWREALRLWRERELRFPAFVRRMTPDDLDMVSGAWARMLATAEQGMGITTIPSEPGR